MLFTGLLEGRLTVCCLKVRLNNNNNNIVVVIIIIIIIIIQKLRIPQAATGARSTARVESFVCIKKFAIISFHFQRMRM